MKSVIAGLLLAPVAAQDIFLASQARLKMEAHADEVPANWASVADTPDDQMLDLTFAVKQRNIDKLQDALLHASTPSSPGYGKWLSNEDVHAMTAPAPEHIASVLGFLEQHGAKGAFATVNGDMISAKVPVFIAEKMLDTNYVTLSHKGTLATAHRTPGGYSLPSNVAEAVDFISPTVHVPGVRLPNKNLMGYTQENTPQNLRTLYSIDAEGKADVPQAVTAFLKQYYSEESLQSFWTQYCDGITCGKGLPKLVGDATTGSPGIESMLDIDTITGVAGNVPSEFWGFSGTSPDNVENEPFMKWLEQVSNTEDSTIPKLFSSSYGEDESSWSEPAANRLNAEFMKVGARGISLLFASGDEGANCKNNKYVPETPSSSPWITAVGGTTPASGFPAPGSETAVGLSSGGFSNYWAMPDYQKNAVASYLQQPGLPTADMGFNTSGRAYPDVAAQATGYCVPPFGCGVSGTSCATPAVAGIIGLLNDLRAQNGKSSLGFLNPLIYSLPADHFQDITTGSSRGCSMVGGWPAKEGWDAVTGRGTLNYSKLAQAVLDLP